MTYVVLEGENGRVVARGLSADDAEKLTRDIGRFGTPNQVTATNVLEEIYDDPELWPPVVN